MNHDLDHEGINRRQFMGRVGATTIGAGAAYYGGSRVAGSPVQNGQAVIPVAIGAAVVGGAAVGYATRYVADKYLGDDFDETAYDSAQADEVHADIIENGKEKAYYDDSMLTNLGNVLSNSKQVAYGDARVDAIEQMNLGNSKQAAIDAAVATVDEFFATQQENLLEHFSVQADNFTRQINTIKNTSGLSISDVFGADFSDSQLSAYDTLSYFDSRSFGYTLATGNVYTYNSFYTRTTAGSSILNDIRLSEPGINTYDEPDTSFMKIFVRPIGSESTDTMFNVDRFATVLQRIETNHSETVSEITNFVETVYPEYQAGDISLEDIVRPSELAAKASDSEENPISGADLAVMGLEADTQSKTTVRLVDDDIVLQGSLYLKSGSGPSLAVGQTYSPSSFTGPVYLAYNDYSGKNADLDTSGVIIVDQQFELTQATGSDGAELASVEYTSEDGQKTTTTDTAELKKELDRLNELQSELQEQQKEVAQGGATTGSSSFSTEQIIAGVVGTGLAAYLLGK
jgi:hypothetical protein